MVGHIFVPSIDSKMPSSVSKDLISFLREEVRRQVQREVLVISDEISMDAVDGGTNNPEAVALAMIQAGCDRVIYAGEISQQKAGNLSPRRKQVFDELVRYYLGQ
jgi:beta-glucosidase-like glycosyl hydrolase